MVLSPPGVLAEVDQRRHFHSWALPGQTRPIALRHFRQDVADVLTCHGPARLAYDLGKGKAIVASTTDFMLASPCQIRRRAFCPCS
jgi:hypothetical protein